MMGLWVDDADCAQCSICSEKFTLLTRRSHCRVCGFVICKQCASEVSYTHYSGLALSGKVCTKFACNLAGIASDTWLHLPIPFHHEDQQDASFFVNLRAILPFTPIAATRRAFVWKLLAEECEFAPTHSADQECVLPNGPEPLTKEGYDQLMVHVDRLASEGDDFYKTIHKKIVKDLHRTFPHSNCKHLIPPMERILLAVVVNSHPSMGYVQGFNYIAAMLLRTFDANNERATMSDKEVKQQDLRRVETESFLVFSRILCRIADFFTPGMIGFNSIVSSLRLTVQQHMPELFDHIEDLAQPWFLFVAPWFLSTFCYSSFPLEFSTILMDFCLLYSYCGCVSARASHAKLSRTTLPVSASEYATRYMEEGGRNGEDLMKEALLKLSLAVFRFNEQALMQANEETFLIVLKTFAQKEPVAIARELIRLVAVENAEIVYAQQLASEDDMKSS